eukprot:TCALIF_09623-PA protein Name:"Protein of unknown function" AED:0.46 eAED:0.35 QI:0/0.33/0/0.42/0.16/0.42/7/0/1453
MRVKQLELRKSDQDVRPNMASKDKVRVIALLAIMFCQIAISQPFQWPKDRVTINRSSEQDQSKKADLKVDLKTESSQQPREIKVIQSDEAQERIAAGRRRPPVIRLAPPRLRRKLPPPQAEEKLFFNGARGRRRPKRPVHGGYGPPRPQYGPPKHRPRPTFKKTRPKFRGRPQPHGHPKPRYPVISYRPRPQYSVPTLPVGYDGPSSYPSPAPIQSDNHDTYGSPPSTTGNNVYPSTVDEDEYGSPKGQPQNDEYGSPLADAQDGYGSPQAPKQEAGTFSGYGGEFNPPSFSISGGNSLEDYGSPSGPTKTINNGAQSQLYQGYESPQTPTQSGYSSPSTDQEDSYGLPQASPAKDLDGFPVPDFNEYAPSGDPVFDFSNDDSDDVENYSSQPRPSSIDDEEDGDISFGFPEFPTPNFLNFPSEYTPDFHFDLKKVNEPDENENEDESTSPSPLTGQYQPPSSFQPSYEIESQEENFDTYESPNPSGATGPNQYNGPPSPNSFPYGASAQENEVEDTYDNGFEPDFQPSGAQHTQYSPPKATSSSSKPSQPFPTSYVNVEDVNSSPYQPHASQGPPQNGQYTPYEEEDEEEEYPNQPSGGDSVYYKPSSSPQTSLYEQSNQNAPKPSPTPSEVYYKPIEGTENEEPSNSNNFYDNGGPAKDFGKYKKIPSFAPPNDKFLYKTPKRPQSSQPSYSEPFSGQPSTGSPPSPSGNFDAYGSPRAPQRYPQAEDDQDEPEIYTQSFNEEENEAPSQHNSYGSPKAPSVEPNDHNNFKQFSPPSNGGGREKYVRQFNSFPTEAPPTKDRNQFFKSRQPSKPSQLDSYGGPEGPVSEEVDVPFTPSQYPAPSSPSFPTSAIEQEDSYDSPRAPPTYPKFQESTNSDIPNQEVVFKYQPEGPEVPPLYSPEEISEDQFDQQFNPEDLKNFEPYSEQSNEFGENEFSESDFGEDEFNQYSPPRENNDEEPSGAFPPGPSGAIKVIEYDPYSEPDDFPSRFENTERPPKQSSRNRQRYQTSDISSSQGPLRTTKARQRTKLIKDASPTPVYKSRQVSNYRSRQKNPTQSSDTFEIHEARPSPTPNRPLSTRPTYNQQTQSNVNFEPSGSSNDDETLPEQPFQPELDGNTYYKDIPTSAPPSRNPVYQSKYQTLPVDDQSGTRGERIRPEYSDQNQAWPSSLNSENEYFETEDSEFDFPTGPNDEETLYKESKSEPEEIKPSRTPYRPSPETPKSTGASQDVSYPRGRTTQAPDLPSYPAVPDQYSTFNPSPTDDWSSDVCSSDNLTSLQDLMTRKPYTKSLNLNLRKQNRQEHPTDLAQKPQRAREHLKIYPAVPDQYSTFNPSPTDENQSNPKEEEPTRTYKQANPRVGENFSDDDFMPSEIRATPSRRPRRPLRPSRRSDTPKEEDEKESDREDMESDGEDAKELKSIGFGPSTFHFGMETPDIWEMFNSEWGQKVKSDN